MASRIQSSPVKELLSMMHAENAEEFKQFTSADLQDGIEYYKKAGNLYFAVGEKLGQLLYALVRSARPRTIVEFGTSLGVSTLYLAAGVADNGGGHILTTEMVESKAATAQETFVKAGLNQYITVLTGDARSTLADVKGPVDFVFLDGMKGLYRDILLILEPILSPGALIVADNITMADTTAYVDRIRHSPDIYQSLEIPLGDREGNTIEVTTKL